jgi:RNA polymerase sigma-70 factor (ECF subfamily)
MEDPFDVWARRLRASDPEACTELFEACYDQLLRYAARLTDEATAYDVVQEAFVALWQMRSSIDPDRSLRSLLYTLVRNEALNRNRAMERRRARRVEYDPQARPDSPDERVEAEALRDRMRDWIDDLPARQREAFRLSRFDGLTHEEIADVMDVAPRTVTNHVTTALRTLRERLDAYRSSPDS